MALVTAVVCGVIILARLKFCHKFVAPFITALFAIVAFAGFTTAQALTPGASEKGSILALLNRIDKTTQDTQEAVTRTEEKVDKIAEGLEGLKTESLLQYSELITAISKEKGVSVAAMTSHLIKLGANPAIKTEHVPRFLEKFADEYLKLRERLLTLDIEDEQLAQIRKNAAAALEDGNAKSARKILSDARQIIKKGRQSSSIKEALLLSDEAELDKLNLDYQSAAEKFTEASDVVSFDELKSASYLFDAADVLSDLGAEFGDNSALKNAIGYYLKVLETYTQDRGPLDWARTQNNLGNALGMLGERESGTARSEQAVTAFQAALEERTQERVPLDWAMTQNNLGNALVTLGERESGTAKLEQAVTAYQAALEERTQDRVPFDWATTQNNLGNALATLGERESGTARLEQAVTAYQAALQEHTQDRVPLDWARTQNNLGTVLQRLGERESGTARLEQAVTAYQAALEEHTQDRVPLKWAGTQNNLGIALATLGERESRTARLEQSVAAYEAALEERTQDRVPLDWAATQNNLGATFRTLGVRESGTARLEQAVTAYEAALEERTQDRVPLQWGRTKYFYINTLSLLADRKRTSDGYDKAASNASNFMALDLEPIFGDLWKSIQAELGNIACWNFALAIEQSRELSNFSRGKENCQIALSIYEADKSTSSFVATSHSFGYLYLVSGEVGKDITMLENAVAIFQDARPHALAGQHMAFLAGIDRDLKRAESVLASMR